MAKQTVIERRPLLGGNGELWRRLPNEPSVGDECIIYDEPKKCFYAGRYLGCQSFELYPDRDVYYFAGKVYWQRCGASLHVLARCLAWDGNNERWVEDER